MSKRSFGQITRLPSKRYRARYTGPDTALHNAPSTFDTRLDAEAWLTDERRLISAGAWSPPTSRAQAAELAELERRQSVFAPYARGWLSGRHDLRATTRASYRTALERHLVPTFGDTPLTEITPNMVRSWFQSYGDRTPTARAHAYQVLVAVMAQAEEDELILRNPCRIKAGGRTTVAREPEVLTLAELLTLAAAMPPQHRALALVCGLCGLRFGEAVALRQRDVDLETGVVSVTRTAVRAGGTKTTNAPKTAAGKRGVAMPALVVDALRDHLAAHPVRGRDALVFPGGTVSCSPRLRCTGARSASSTAAGSPIGSVPTASMPRARSSASRSCTGTTFVGPPQRWGRSRGRPCERCSTDSGTPRRRWRCATRPRPLSATAPSPTGCRFRSTGYDLPAA